MSLGIYNSIGPTFSS